MGADGEKIMAMKNRTTCAVPECGAPISGYSNLCDEHRVPGGVVRVDDSTMIITAWAVEHGDECGIVLLNDFALGDRFSGRAGFKSKLRDQGFVNVRLLSTPEELAAAKKPAEGKKAGAWSGSWKSQYPWHAPKKKRTFSDLRAIVLTNVVGQDGDALMALVFQDEVKLKYPDGYARTFSINGRLETPASLDELIDLAKIPMRAYCSTVTPETPELTVHRSPAGMDDEGTRKWLESLPRVRLVEHPERPEGLNGPLLPAGQAG